LTYDGGHSSHRYDDLEKTLNSTGRWANERVPYDFIHGTGTYFASAFDRFLSHVFLPRLPDPATAFVVFPDRGAHRRFYTMVRTAASFYRSGRTCCFASSQGGCLWTDDGAPLVRTALGTHLPAWHPLRKHPLD
jgi:hypothetical protein